MQYIKTYDSIAHFRADLDSHECVCTAIVPTDLGLAIGYQREGRFVFYVDDQLISNDNLETIDYEAFNNTNEPIIAFEYDTLDDTNNGNAVDLGLPSGTKWMKSNVGAAKPSDFGNFYQWGDTQGYEGASEHQFSWNDYKWGSAGNLAPKYEFSGFGTLQDEDDALFVATRGEMRMPTQAQLQELKNSTEHRWLHLENGVNGMKFWKKGIEEPTDGDSYIFIPAAGYCRFGSRYDLGSFGNVWSASRDGSIAERAWCMSFNTDDISMTCKDRYFGCSVRGILA